MAEKHKHVWEHHLTVPESEAGTDVRAVHARLPQDHPDLRDEEGLIKAEYVDSDVAAMRSHDPKNKEHVQMLRDKGVRDFSQPPPREPHEVFLCECGEAISVPIGEKP